MRRKTMLMFMWLACMMTGSVLAGCRRTEPLIRAAARDEAILMTEDTQQTSPADETEEETGSMPQQADCTDSAEGGGAAAAAETVTVYICGAVNRPGVFTVEAGTRLVTLVALAGGLTGDGDASWINLAQEISDGQMIRVRTREETRELLQQGITAQQDKFGIVDPVFSDVSGGPQSGFGVPGPGTDAGEDGTADDLLVNINSASADELMTLPGIGEARAESIIAYRERNGAFDAAEQIQNVSGIGASLYEQIRALIYV